MTPPGPEPEKLPPYVLVMKTPTGCQVVNNLVEPWLTIALLEMAKDVLLDELKCPQLVKPHTDGVSGFLRRMRG